MVCYYNKIRILRHEGILIVWPLTVCVLKMKERASAICYWCLIQDPNSFYHKVKENSVWLQR